MGAIINFFKKILGIENQNQNLLGKGQEQVVDNEKDEQNKYEEELRKFEEKKEKVDKLLEEVKAEKESVEEERDEELFSEKPEEEKDYEYITKCNVKIEELTNRVDELENESYRLEKIIFDMETNNPERQRIMKSLQQHQEQTNQNINSLKELSGEMYNTLDDSMDNERIVEIRDSYNA